VIKAVCFDVAGVMTQPIGTAFMQQINAAGLQITDLANSSLMSFSVAGDGDVPAHRLERGELTLEEFFALLSPSDRASRPLMDPASRYFVPGVFEPHDGMHAFVREVRDAGLRTALITNSVAEWVPWWDRLLPAGVQFDETVHSCRVGLRKPNAAIYYHALVRLGVEPGEALYLDDFEAMVEGAREVGMGAVHVIDHDRAIAEARTLLGLG